MLEKFKSISQLILNIASGANQLWGPQWILKQAKNKLKRENAILTSQLQSQATSISSLLEQNQKWEARVEYLQSKIERALKNDNSKEAGAIALELQATKSDLEENQKQAESQEEIYNRLKEARDINIKKGQRELEMLQRRFERNKIQEQNSRQEAVSRDAARRIEALDSDFEKLHNYADNKAFKTVGQSKLNKLLEETNPEKETQQTLQEKRALEQYLQEKSPKMQKERSKQTN